MPRRYYRRRRSANRDKYSIEQTNICTTAANTWPVVDASSSAMQQSKQFAIPIVNPVESQGMRKVKHLTVTISNTTEGTNDTVFYAIVFVPQGYEPQPIQYPKPGFAVNNYEANQFVMSSGVIDFTGGPCRIRSPLSRNLNSGDRIYLILASTFENVSMYSAQVQYAITNQ